MKVDDALRGIARVFLDTAPVVYSVEQDVQFGAVADACFDRIDAGTLQAITSPVTLAECLVGVHKYGHAGLEQVFLDLIVTGRFTSFVPVGEDVARRAADFRIRYNLSLPDAMQLGVAVAAGCDGFLTNDIRFKRVTELQVIVLADLEV